MVGLGAAVASSWGDTSVSSVADSGGVDDLDSITGVGVGRPSAVPRGRFHRRMSRTAHAEISRTVTTIRMIRSDFFIRFTCKLQCDVLMLEIDQNYYTAFIHPLSMAGEILPLLVSSSGFPSPTRPAFPRRL
jgi:hypothetical protein